MNKRRLAAIARWLEAGAPEKKHVKSFSMKEGIVFWERKGTHKETLGCGTTCCIAGAAVQFFNKPLNLMEHGGLVDDSFAGHTRLGWGFVSREAQELLDLTERVGRELFSPTSFTGVLEVIDAPWAARCIRKLIKTGEVDWEGTREAVAK